MTTIKTEKDQSGDSNAINSQEIEAKPEETPVIIELEVEKPKTPEKTVVIDEPMEQPEKPEEEPVILVVSKENTEKKEEEQPKVAQQPTAEVPKTMQQQLQPPEIKSHTKVEGTVQTRSKLNQRSRAPSIHMGDKKRGIAQYEVMSNDSQQNADMLNDKDDAELSEPEDPLLRKSRKKVKARNPMPILINPNKPKKVPYKRKPINVNGIRLDTLTFGTLRRYQYFFGLDKRADLPFVNDRERLLEQVEEHFANELDVNPIDIMFRFLSTKKDPDQPQKDQYDTRHSRRTLTRNNEN